MADHPPARDFAAVLDAELEAIRELRRMRGEECAPFEGEDPVQRAHDADLFGLSISGGGIRSATFNLGIACGLARLGLLSRFDYLSINSGGGYFGGWLSAWIQRRGMKKVEGELASLRALPEAGEETVMASEPQEVSFLRQFSNYLTPRVGAFSADTWTMVATYLRNLLLNQSILILALAALLLIPRLVILLADRIEALPLVGLPPALLCLTVAVVMIGLNLSTMIGREDEEAELPAFTRLPWVQALVVLPLFLAAWIGGAWIWFVEVPPGDWTATGWFAERIPALQPMVTGHEADLEPVTFALCSALLYAGVWLISGLFGLVKLRRAPVVARRRFLRLWPTLLVSALPAGAVGGILIWLLTVACAAAGDELGTVDPWHLFHQSVWNGPVIILIFMLTAFVHTGLTGRVFVDSLREWWSRLGAWMLIYAITWIGLFGMAVYAPSVLLWLKGFAVAIASAWGVTTIAGVLIGKRSRPADDRPPAWRRLLLAVAPQVFIIGLVAFLALGIHTVLEPDDDRWVDGAGNSMRESCDWLVPPPEAKMADAEPRLGTDGRPLVGDDGQVLYTEPRQMRDEDGEPIFVHKSFGEVLDCQTSRMWASTSEGGTSALFLALVAIAAFLSWRIDINQFSMHLFYRNRLVRAYLGASNRRRKPQPFTAFDPYDDMPLTHLSPHAGYDGPFQLHNTALNLVGGEELAWQERKAASFVFTPLYSGFEVGASSSAHAGLGTMGFRPTAGYEQTEEGVTLGTAVGISGAAVSPAMGAQSRSDLAFLLTVFNVRLGWWLGNPRVEKTWDRMGPRIGLATLLSELLGFTNESSKYVYLSDGGHFDNLGLYELVRRRCRFIVLTDAGADPKATFTDLGGAIRKCRVDFGVEIEIDVSQLRPLPGERNSYWHCAVGEVFYDRVDDGAAPGLLIYLKATLTGDEPEDVQNYAAENPEFPHESTADQWFGESQFESYRRLGEHVALTAFDAAGDAPAEMDKGFLFSRLREAWYPPSPNVKEFFTRHSGRLDQLMERLRSEPDLAFLTAQLYPDWEALTQRMDVGETVRTALPESHQELRSGLYFCTSIIQLLENVYIDLNLEQEFTHPDNRGWLNLLHFWSGSAMFRVTWAISAASFGARFQSFAERRCGLRLGELTVAEHRMDGELPERQLSAREREMLEEMHRRRGRSDDRLIVFDLWVAHPGHGADGTAIGIGFAVVDRDDRLVYFRIRGHLRRVGLARRALLHLMRHHGVSERAADVEMTALMKRTGEGDVARFARLFDAVRRTAEAHRPIDDESPAGEQPGEQP